jgi:membrane-anchored glycerophosphoryl diester phosphodiesterase (GDPDase)
LHPIAVLFVLAIPVAAISWSVTHEELFRETRDWCTARSRSGSMFRRKFFYILTCEYCFSHYVTALLLAMTQFTLIYDDWRGYFVAGFSLVWIANLYMSLFARLRLDIKEEGLEIKQAEKKLKE